MNADRQRSKIKSDLRKFFSESFGFNESVDVLDDAESLKDAGIVDSFGVMSLVTFLEETYDIQVKDEEVLPENLDTVDRITDYVMRKTAAAS
ncbi:MAG: acyl carrier protein [Planctomycetota bacterium]|nr:acyl carrier protein [Planctomycetaceae bacterium]MDQ3332776.1 acyl carrier protein [Planctomycetota bacterium]